MSALVLVRGVPVFWVLEWAWNRHRLGMAERTMHGQVVMGVHTLKKDQPCVFVMVMAEDQWMRERAAAAGVDTWKAFPLA